VCETTSYSTDWLASLAITNLEHGEALLSGTLADQAALYGVLARIRDLNLRLIAVNVVQPDQQEYLLATR
jgi:hypothetical protein